MYIIMHVMHMGGNLQLGTYNWAQCMKVVFSQESAYTSLEMTCHKTRRE